MGEEHWEQERLLRARDRAVGIHRPVSIGSLWRSLRQLPGYSFGMPIVSLLLLPFFLAPIMPDKGFQLWPGTRAQGLLEIPAEDGSPVRFSKPDALVGHYRRWVASDRHMPLADCVLLDRAARAQLRADAPPRPDAGGVSRLWVDMEQARSLGRDDCSGKAGAAVGNSVVRIIEAVPVPCGKERFLAHNFACPTGRQRVAPLLGNISDYYPPAALRAGSEGRVVVSVEVDLTETVLACDIVESSGSEILDRQTCKLVGTDPAFPVSTAAGAGNMRQSVMWQLAD